MSSPDHEKSPSTVSPDVKSSPEKVANPPDSSLAKGLRAMRDPKNILWSLGCGAATYGSGYVIYKEIQRISLDHLHGRGPALDDVVAVGMLAVIGLLAGHYTFGPFKNGK